MVKMKFTCRKVLVQTKADIGESQENRHASSMENRLKQPVSLTVSKLKKMAKGISATDLLYRKQVKVLSHGIRKMMVENSMPKFL